MKSFSIWALAACIAFVSSVAIQQPHDNAKIVAGGSESGSGPRFPEPKHFSEYPPGGHYDARFYQEKLQPDHKHNVIQHLMKTLLATFRDIGVETWLMHGSLLGWWWGKKVMPWDFDADVQVAEADMYFLAAYFNMTVHYYNYDGIPEGRYYLLEINPHFEHRGQDDFYNVIDARWVDMATGLYIDITAARYDVDHEQGEGILYDKNGHEYRDTYVFPLRDTTFEGVPAKIPFRYEQMLESEYGKGALTNKEYYEHVFYDEKMEWIHAEDL